MTRTQNTNDTAFAAAVNHNSSPAVATTNSNTANAAGTLVPRGNAASRSSNVGTNVTAITSVPNSIT